MQQKNHPDFDPVNEMMPYYKALHKKGVNVDFIHSCDTLDGYKLILLPYKYILTEAFAQKLSVFVENGGILLATCRSGVKNEDNIPHALTLPGYLRRITGIRVEEYETIPSGKNYKINYANETHEGTFFADWITPETAETLACFDEEDISFPAITRNAYGGGAAYYAGTVPSEALADKLMTQIINEKRIRHFDLPAHTEAVLWKAGAGEYLFVINHTRENVTVLNTTIKANDIEVIKL
jgi:beta-galactosidase